VNIFFIDKIFVKLGKSTYEVNDYLGFNDYLTSFCITIKSYLYI